MTEIVAYTALDGRKLPGYIRYCRENRLDPKLPVSFRLFWAEVEVDAAALFHIGIVSDVENLSPLCSPYGLHVATQYVYGSLVSWGLLFKRKPNSNLVRELLPQFKGLNLYELIRI